MNEGSLNKDQQDQLLFMMLIQQHQQIGMMGLGKLKNPATDDYRTGSRIGKIRYRYTFGTRKIYRRKFT